MRTSIAAVLAATLLPAGAIAEETSAEAFARLATRIEAAQQALGVAPQVEASGPHPGFTMAVPKGAMQTAVGMMEQVVTDFRTNRWIRVKGFKIGIGVPPRIDIELEVPPPPSSTAAKP